MEHAKYSTLEGIEDQLISTDEMYHAVWKRYEARVIKIKKVDACFLHASEKGS